MNLFFGKGGSVSPHSAFTTPLPFPCSVFLAALALAAMSNGILVLLLSPACGEEVA